MTSRNVNALYLDPNANPGQVEGEHRNTMIMQELGETMNTSLRDEFATINVAGFTVAPNVLSGGDQADEAVVTLTGTGLELTFTPAAACALAAALQAVAVHQMEQQPREIRRTTEPGQPVHEELNGAGL